jgi:putative hydrolase
MIDLHTHTLLSDGALVPSELVYRAKFKGYTAIALTDHVDFSNIDFIIPRISRIVKELNNYYNINVIPGAEITYVPPELISKAVKLARKLGAKIVVVHGETMAETVPEGTNTRGILSGADILAHPGMLTAEDAALACKSGVHLEITTRRGHRDTNSRIAKLAKASGAKLVFNTDTHTPENLMCEQIIAETLSMSGISRDDFIDMQNNSKKLLTELRLT